MTTLREAAQQALEALKCLVETHEMGNTIRADIVDAEEAIASLKAALEQPEQEQEPGFWGRVAARQSDKIKQLETALRAPLKQPEQEEYTLVAWRFQSPLSEEGQWEYGKEPPVGSRWAVEPLYTHPPRRTGLPHCERSCEANAFQIEIRRLTGEVRMLQEQNTELDRKLAALEQPDEKALPPWPPVSQWQRSCAVCNIGASGQVIGYVCSRSDCPTRITCGGTV